MTFNPLFFAKIGCMFGIYDFFELLSDGLLNLWAISSFLTPAINDFHDLVEVSRSLAYVVGVFVLAVALRRIRLCQEFFLSGLT